jgi:NAD(P)-dependent dehydrogenase (short-subunit alcohol dehydrogenase family)
MTSQRITTDFDATSTAQDVIKGIELEGRRAIVTGGASGIGIETARALSGAGAEVTLAVRDLDAGARTALDITRDTGNEQILVAKLDLSDQASVAGFVAAWQGSLDLLINNAGVMASPLSRTAQGWESQFATNHLGHYALTVGLHDALAAAAGSRVVALSSAAHLDSPMVFDDIHFGVRPYDPALAYAQSKTANVLFAVEATRRWSSDGITVNAVHPGAILTNLTRHYDPKVLSDVVDSGNYTFKTPRQGAATSVLVATSPLLDGIGGRYFEDCNQGVPHDPNGERRGVAAHALDPASAERLWKLSAAATGRDA